MNVASRFAQTARRLADKQAVFDDAGAWTYGRLLAEAQAVGGQVRGATRRRRVGLAAPTSAAFAVGYFGILLADRVPVPLNYLLDAKTLGFMAADAGLDTVVAAQPFHEMPKTLGCKAIFLEDVSGTGGGSPARLPRLRRGGDDEATLLYTSGTTDRPKGVLLTHRNFIRNVEGSTAHIDIGPQDVFLGVLPLFHSFGLTTSLLLPLLAGCSSVYLARFGSQRVFEAIARRGVTIVFAVASMFRVLIRAGCPAGAGLRSLRFAIAGGEALGAPLAAQFQETFGVPLLEGYGLTETSPVVAVNLPHENRQGSAGRMLAWVEARVVDEAGGAVAPGCQGELWLRGECIAAGYHARPAETAEAFTPDGWFRTGDLARVDGEGYLCITGRKKDLIISAGENISPNEIESVLQEHPAVFEAAVLGVPDEARGEVPKAFVTFRQGAAAAAEELAAFCRGRLPRFKVPVTFEFRTELPHGPTGKVHKLALRQAEGAS